MLPFRKPLEVPVVYAEIDPLTWEYDEHVRRGLRCVTVEWNLAVAETVSVSLSSANPDEYQGASLLRSHAGRCSRLG